LAVSAIAVSLNLGLSFAPLRAEFKPPNRGTPGRLEGAGTRLLEPEDFQPPDPATPDTTRGACRTLPDADATPLTPVVPSELFGVTLRDYPTFWIYVPELPETAQLEFAVTQWQFEETPEGEEVREREVYVGRFDAPTEGGIVPLSLPEETESGEAIAPLEVEGDYTWFVRVICDPEHPTRYGPEIWAEAWVKRLNPSPEFALLLDEAQPLVRYDLLAETGVWYDALDRLARLRLEADTPERQAQWQQLLESVGLDAIDEEALLNPDF
jgi:hypothetical protein